MYSNIHVPYSSKTNCSRKSPYSARRTSATGAVVTNGNEIGSQWHISVDKLCSSIGLHFLAQGPERPELKSVFWFNVGSVFFWVKVPAAIWVQVSPHSVVFRYRKAVNLCCSVWGFFRVEFGRKLSQGKQKKTGRVGYDVSEINKKDATVLCV